MKLAAVAGLGLVLAAGLWLGLRGNPASADGAITVSARMDPPRWAILERQLLAANVPAAREFFDKYFDARGYLQCFRALGRQRWARRCVRAISIAGRSCTRSARATRSCGCIRRGTRACCSSTPRPAPPRCRSPATACTTRNSSSQSDWMHHGEGMQLFNRMGLSIAGRCDLPGARAPVRRASTWPRIPTRRTTIRTLKIIRSMQNGSRGPMLRKATAHRLGRRSVRRQAVRRRAWRVDVQAVPRALRGIHRRRRRSLPERGGDDAADQRVPADRRSEVQALGRRTTWMRGWTACARTAASSPATSASTARSAARTANGGGARTAGDSARSIPSPADARIATASGGRSPGFGNALLLTGDQKYVDAWRDDDRRGERARPRRGRRDTISDDARGRRLVWLAQHTVGCRRGGRLVLVAEARGSAAHARASIPAGRQPAPTRRSAPPAGSSFLRGEKPARIPSRRCSGISISSASAWPR